MGRYLYITGHHYLAAGGVACEHSVWAIFLFYKIYQKDRGQDGNREKSGVRRQESGVGKVLRSTVSEAILLLTIPRKKLLPVLVLGFLLIWQ